MGSKKMKLPQGSQEAIWTPKVLGWPDPKAGLERMILDDATGLYTEECLICGSKLNTVGEVYHRACDNCWSRR